MKSTLMLGKELTLEVAFKYKSLVKIPSYAAKYHVMCPYENMMA